LKISLYSSKDSKFNFEFIFNEIKNLREIFIRNKIFDDNDFIQWHNDFKLIYGSNFDTIELYIQFLLIYFSGILFLIKNIPAINEGLLSIENLSIKEFKKFQKKINEKYLNYNLFHFNYFNSILNFPESDLNYLNSIVLKLVKLVFDLNIESIYKFDFLIQNIISPFFRHKSGEYYTPPFLVKSMVEKTYEIGEKVLDPCCGTGNFLLEILKTIISSDKFEGHKIAAINKIYGYDINPISIFTAKISFLILLKDFSSKVFINLFVRDSLFSDETDNSFDLVIGNPPWGTYRDMESTQQQEKMKKLAEKLEIKPAPKNILNIEISSLFFYQAKELYLKVNGKLFFVITKGVITGSHASLFRSFKGFKNMFIWTFDKRLENIFNIDFICLFAQKSSENSLPKTFEIPNQFFEINAEENDIDYFSDFKINLVKTDIFVPYFIEKKGNKAIVKKMIPKYLMNNLVSIEKSHYKNLFHKGADLNPRNLIFVKIQKIRKNLVKISPDDRVFKRAKAPWNTKVYDHEIIETDYIFKVIKSTELVKFYIYDSYDVFLPLSKKDLSYNPIDLSQKAVKFYNKINNIYLIYKKDTTKHKSLIENLNRWSKLINSRQLSLIKVVYNNSGSNLHSAVVLGDILITGDLSFFSTDNIDEAYYLSAILNSDFISNQIKIKKSSRHIFKIPFDVPIKVYDENDKNHKKMAELGKLCENLVKSIIQQQNIRENPHFSKFRIQIIIKRELKTYIEQIDEILQIEYPQNRKV
jgi:SAM-dependent methyltransferase